MFYVSYGILTDERNSYVRLQRSTEIWLRTNGNVTLETMHDYNTKQQGQIVRGYQSTSLMVSSSLIDFSNRVRVSVKLL